MSAHPLRPSLFPYTTLFRSTRRITLSATITEARRPGYVSCRTASNERGVAISGAALLRARPGSEPMSGTAANLLCAKARSEEHTSELQSRLHLVCRLLLEKK